MNAFLNRQVRLLVARYGREQVTEALSNAGEAEPPQRRPAAARPRPKNPPARRPKRPRKTPLEVVEAAQVDPEVRPVIERIAVAYEAREILPERWRVKKFLASEGVDADRIRSRADALPTVVEVLATLPRERLEDLLSGWREHAERGDLAILADAILGPPKAASPAGRRQRLRQESPSDPVREPMGDSGVPSFSSGLSARPANRVMSASGPSDLRWGNE